jgi:iron-siderophore transport system substrate-binding protein
MGTDRADRRHGRERDRGRGGRRAGAGLALLLLLAAAVGCSGGDDGDVAAADGEAGAAEEASGAGAAAGPEDGAFPVTIEHEFGETTIESEPERVVTVGLTEQDALLALGVVPVATTEWFGEHPGAVFPWAEDELEALGADPPESVGDATALNVEAVAAQRPDLILAVYSDISEEQYEQLSVLAPTVASPEGYDDFGVPWDEQTKMVGQAVGRPAAADDLVADVEDAVATARDEHPEFDGASAMMATPYEGTYVYGPEDVRGRFLTDLGFELPEGLAGVTGSGYGGNLSNERADLLDVDVIVWLDPEDGEGPLGGPLYDSLTVHQEGREVPLDSFDDPLGAATSFVTVLSLPYLLDGIVPRLAEAIDGDPATQVPPSP